ncbi:hypothetical protein [Actinomadura rupiterrae]|uniref:hypothetical protein n=1 Tax=Actinomadura rupiterrae TaxID=559627 RepID=UPI0020A50BEE|nr:hypothetical protein [Actinomadura rupiterrae]MCP2337668.1 putative lipoprotein with Yx(FWY)xxD motif [Actinomadura rupiterrae]
MRDQRWTISAAAVLAASGLALGACGTHHAGQKDAAAGSPATPAAANPGTVQPATLEVAAIDKIGKVVTDGQGRTLYRFDKDTAKPSGSSCLDACAKTWPPVWAGAEDTKVRGIDRALLGKVKRPDGKWQVTLAGWPLYRFAKDAGPGEAKGQGVGGTWFASAPDGKKAGSAPSGKQPRWTGWTVLKAKGDPKLGKIITDGQGRTLYRFDKDTPKPPTSNCSGACRQTWPVVVFNGWKHLKLDGIDRKAVGFIERKDDGVCQVTVNGWPLYTYSKDVVPGDTKGQGVGGTWFASTPDGKKAMAPAGSGGSGDGSGGGGYGGGGYGY